jgi:DNA-directed RNA polymerase specialized sigma24 family protein
MSSSSKGALTEAHPLHRIFREVLRHYTEFRELVRADGRADIIEHSYMVYPEDGEPEKHTVTISFWDLHRGIKELSPRKREALFHNVILDKKQKTVAEHMGITTVSVGQYVEQAVLQLAEQHFAEDKVEKVDGHRL